MSKGQNKFTILISLWGSLSYKSDVKYVMLYVKLDCMKTFNYHNLPSYVWDSGYTVGKKEYYEAYISVPVGMVIKQVSW